jgi:hypothetical protein
MFKDKILAQLLIKHAGVSKLILEKIAESLSKTVTDETKIADAITALDNLPISVTDYAGLLQVEGDRRVTDLQKEHAKEIDKLKKQAPAKPVKEPEADEIPAWAKKLQEDNQALIERLTAKEAAETRQSLTTKLFSDPTLKDIPDSFRNKFSVEKEDDISVVAAKIVSEYTALKQDMVNKGVVTEAPAGTQGGKLKDNEASPEAKAYAENIVKPAGAMAGKPIVTSAAN